MKYLIAGLGNIGDEYANTRHNAGFGVLDYIAEKEGLTFTPGRYAFTAEKRIRGKVFCFIKPSTYMNNSGKCIRYWLNKHSIPVENLLVVVDDIALPLGTIRMRMKGGDGGHNGLNNIIFYLSTENFTRLRIGIGDSFNKGQQVDYVLGEWEKDERKQFDALMPRIYDMIRSFAFEGTERTMSRYNE